MVMRSEKLTETQLKLALRIASSYYLDKVSQTYCKKFRNLPTNGF